MVSGSGGMIALIRFWGRYSVILATYSWMLFGGDWDSSSDSVNPGWVSGF